MDFTNDLTARTSSSDINVPSWIFTVMIHKSHCFVLTKSVILLLIISMKKKFSFTVLSLGPKEAVIRIASSLYFRFRVQKTNDQI